MTTEERKEFDVVAGIFRVAALGSKESSINIGWGLNRDNLEKYMLIMMAPNQVSVNEEN